MDVKSQFMQAGVPLWIGHVQPKQSDVPACPLCHGPREFEFQVMPQILAVLKVGVL